MILSTTTVKKWKPNFFSELINNIHSSTYLSIFYLLNSDSIHSFFSPNIKSRFYLLLRAFYSLFTITYHFLLLSGKKKIFSSVAQSCPTLCDPINCSTPGLPVHHHLPEFTQTHVHRVGDIIQPSHPLSSPSPPAPNPSQHQSLFQWVNSSHEVAKVLEFQL